MHYIYILFITFFFISCAPTTPKVSEYRINIQPDNKIFTDTNCKKQSLKIGQAFSSSSLMSVDMNYGVGDYKQLVFSQSAWAQTPNRAITSAISKYLKSTQLFKNVQISKSRTRNHLLLETDIEDFMQYFSVDAKSSYANVVITFTLINSQTNQVIATKTFKERKVVDIIDANGGVIALNKALEALLQKSGKWFNGVCK